MQILHFAGQAIELALKGYILACGEDPKNIHNLGVLAEKAEELGLKFQKIEASSIVLVNHYFYQDLGTQTKFKTRYPAKVSEMVGGPIPDIKVIHNLIESIIQCADAKCKNIDLGSHL